MCEQFQKKGQGKLFPYRNPHKGDFCMTLKLLHVNTDKTTKRTKTEVSNVIGLGNGGPLAIV